MVNKSILKDAIREIKNTKKKFISIVLVIMVGVGFFVGLKSTSYDMKITANKYYKDTNLFDIKLISSSGLYKTDLMKIKSIKGVKNVSLYKTKDVITTVNNNDYVIRLNSIDEDKDAINKFILTSGKMPTTINEGLVEDKFLKENNLILGDLITLKPENEDDLRAKKIRIVGTVKSSYYMSKNKYGSNLKNGKINYYMYIPLNDFNTSYYTEGFVTIENASIYNCYSKSYENYISKYKEEINNVIAKSTVEHYELNKEEISNTIDYLQQEQEKLSSNEDLIDIKNKLETAKNELDNLKEPSAMAILRTEDKSFYEYKLEADRIENISKVFPVIFFLVAALVSLTSMTRIVDEERIQIGTLQALGYNKIYTIFKYILYAILSSLIGSILGSILFYKLVPLLVSICYLSFYDMPFLITVMQRKYMLFASLLALLSTIVATIFAFYFDVKQTPATLMKPKSPKKGKRIFLEKLEKLWNKLSFLNKITFRNIFRYKKRMIMTIVGICGCTSLLLTAFGLRNSVNNIVDKQFNKINKYDISLSIKSNLNKDEISTLKDNINNTKNVSKVLLISKENLLVKRKKEIESVNVIVPENKKDLSKFIDVKNSDKLSDNGVIITSKLSKLLNADKGDYIIIIKNGLECKVKVLDVSKNYIDHYIYMSPTLYKKKFKEINYTNILTFNKKNNDKSLDILNKELEKIHNITSISNTKDVIKSYNNMMGTLNYVTTILIISAGLLAFVVLYNLASINISERLKELATIKVLGFYDNEVTSYIYKENIILTLLGSLLGLVFGSILTYYVVKVCETNIFMFTFNIKLSSYLLSIIITFIFLFIVNIFMHKELKKINIKEALKSYE